MAGTRSDARSHAAPVLRSDEIRPVGDDPRHFARPEPGRDLATGPELLHRPDGVARSVPVGPVGLGRSRALSRPMPSSGSTTSRVATSTSITSTCRAYRRCRRPRRRRGSSSRDRSCLWSSRPGLIPDGSSAPLPGEPITFGKLTIYPVAANVRRRRGDRCPAASYPRAVGLEGDVATTETNQRVGDLGLESFGRLDVFFHEERLILAEPHERRKHHPGPGRAAPP